MSFTAFTPRFSYAGDGATVAFSFPRGFFAATDLKVYLVDNTTGVATLQTLVTHYNVTGGGSGSASGTVTFVAAPAVGKTVVIYRATDQSNNLTAPGGGNPTQPEVDQFDRSMIVSDEILLKTSFMPFMPLTYTGTFNFQLPTPVAGKVIGYTATGFSLYDLSTQWLQGSGVPSASLGRDGDMYLRTSNNDVYQKISGAWTLIANFSGSGGALLVTDLADQATAEAGANNTKWMSPLRVAQAWIAQLHAASSKTPPVDADELALADSAASFALKKLTWANLKAAMKTYFESLFYNIRTIQFVIDGGGATITTGVKGDQHVPYACTILEWTLLADQTGSIQIDIWKDSYANYPPVVGDTITASAKPLISSGVKAQSSTLTGWTTAIAANDTIRWNVDSVTTIQRVTVALKVQL